MPQLQLKKKTKKKKKQIIPGFGLSLGFSLSYLSLLVLIPLSTIFIYTSQLGWGGFFHQISQPIVIAAYRLSFTTALIASLINLVFGVLTAWVLVRYSFPGRKLIDGLLDLPFALPTSVAGITLATLYSTNGWVGRLLPFKVSYTQIGIIVALVLIGMPFVVRIVEPVLQNMDKENEEASAILGANRFQTLVHVVFPKIRPAAFSGFALAFSRALGEYGSVVFIAGNMPFKTEIAPLVIMQKLEGFDYDGATSVALVLLVASFLILFLINFSQWLVKRRYVN
ncbi:sulfate ABC transporter permease subunit CysT [Sporolactobacillus shoreicorticis]|uniref:Sulfate transport system permease protein CysT n=1 Tax=Sporolactobacillus shoreicorticis TaxID=1923877 RepID=A0ABW5S3C8_9BACL|nr:sulfate ABC transporter permease subunit CysT [Sporolactobacillus shoreicorticis]MCO7127678.1 sulfate ABC transporter permease subunit CysT [Sporolactobacillus shoreicorticis]